MSDNSHLLANANVPAKKFPLLKVLLPVIIILLTIVFLAPQARELPKTWERLSQAKILPLLFACLFQATRYLGAGFLISLCTRILPQPQSGLRASIVALASGAASRLLPIAGAGGVAVRYSYLKKSGMPDSAIAAYFILQNILGTASLLFLFLATIIYASVSGNSSTLGKTVILPSIGTIALFTALLIWIYNQPEGFKAAAAWLGQTLDNLLNRWFHRSYMLEQKIKHGADSMQQALTFGGKTGSGLIEGLFYSSWTILGDVLSLFFVALAFSAGNAFVASVVSYFIGSFAASAAAMPAGLGVTEGAMAASLVTFTMPLDQAVAIVLIFRAISFWLPLLFGAFAAIYIKKRGLI